MPTPTVITNIVGTFPILTFKKSQTDEFGFDYVSYQYTVKTSELSSYDIKKDDIFTGFSETYRATPYSKNPSFTGQTYVVDTVETNNIAGGLTEIMINTIGTKNSVESNPPRVCLLSGGPLIFGLIGTPPSGNIQGYGISGAGQSVEVRFLASGGIDGQQTVFQTNLASSMPLSFRGVPLPAPAQPPQYFTNVQYKDNSGPGVVGGGLPYGTDGYYYGFVCKTILTEKRGSLLLVTLVFSEAGMATVYTITGQNTGSGYFIYNFPRIG